MPWQIQQQDEVGAPHAHAVATDAALAAHQSAGVWLDSDSVSKGGAVIRSSGSGSRMGSRDGAAACDQGSIDGAADTGDGDGDSSTEAEKDKEKLEQLASEHQQLKRRLVDSEAEVRVFLRAFVLCGCVCRVVSCRILLWMWMWVWVCGRMAV